MKKLTGLMVGIWVVMAGVAYADGLLNSMHQSASGMKAQGERMKVISQNIANADSTGMSPGEEPYRRKVISFTSKRDRATGADMIVVDKITKDNKSPLAKRYDPAHPAANEDGYVLYPNVKESIEMMDMREAERSYEANLGAIDTTRNMYLRTIELLR